MYICIYIYIICSYAPRIWQRISMVRRSCKNTCEYAAILGLGFRVLGLRVLGLSLLGF